MNKIEENPNLSVFWIIWGAIFSSLFLYQFQLGGGLPEGSNTGSPPAAPMALSIAVITIATLIRWLLIPKAKERGKLLVLMIIGIAMAESAQLFQLFMLGDEYPESQLQIFILSVIAVGQFVPVYIKKQISS